MHDVITVVADPAEAPTAYPLSAAGPEAMLHVHGGHPPFARLRPAGVR